MDRRTFITSVGAGMAAGAAILCLPLPGEAKALVQTPKMPPNFIPTGVAVWEEGTYTDGGISITAPMWVEKDWSLLRKGDRFKTTHPHYNRYNAATKRWVDEARDEVDVAATSPKIGRLGIWEVMVEN